MTSLAKATKGKAGMAVGKAHVRLTTAGTGLRVGAASAVLPATSEFMDVTAGETAPNLQASCRIAPCTVKAAMKKISEWHRHLPDIQGGLFAAQCLDPEGNCVGVAMAGNPSRVWQGQAKLVISRVATQGYENACSALYGALCRAAKALGYREVWTYTLPHEPGTSLRAAGFVDMGMTDGGEHDRKSRRRKPAVNPAPKRRWLRRLSA